MSTLIRTTVLYMITILAIFAASSDAFQSGNDAYEKGQYEAAKTQFSAAVEINETAAARHNLGLAHFQLGAPAEAVWQLERAQLLAPFNADYRFKLGAVRQELGLFASAPKWYRLASQILSNKAWLTLATISFWLLIATFILPRTSGSKVGIGTKSLRFLSIFTLIIAIPSIWLNYRLLQSGTVIADEAASLHAAPASAAPESGSARPGERGRILDQYNDFYEIETEGLATGWISKQAFRPLAD